MQALPTVFNTSYLKWIDKRKTRERNKQQKAAV